MTSIRDLTNDLVTQLEEINEQLYAGELSSLEYKDSKAMLVDEYLELIKERLVG